MNMKMKDDDVVRAINDSSAVITATWKYVLLRYDTYVRM